MGGWIASVSVVTGECQRTLNRDKACNRAHVVNWMELASVAGEAQVQREFLTWEEEPANQKWENAAMPCFQSSLLSQSVVNP